MVLAFLFLCVSCRKKSVLMRYANWHHTLALVVSFEGFAVSLHRSYFLFNRRFQLFLAVDFGAGFSKLHRELWHILRLISPWFDHNSCTSMVGCFPSNFEGPGSKADWFAFTLKRLLQLTLFTSELQSFLSKFEWGDVSGFCVLISSALAWARAKELAVQLQILCWKGSAER